MALSIGGIELRSAVWRSAFEDAAGSDISTSEDEAAAVALGYVAQFVDRLVGILFGTLGTQLFACANVSRLLRPQMCVYLWL